MSDAKIKVHASAIGRRKEAIASVRLISGSGQILVNTRSAADYFPGLIAKMKLAQVFTLANSTKYDASVKVSGGGRFGQLDATVLGLARAFSELKEENKNIFRLAGLLTRDSRERQRRMIGTGGKSRRRKQSPKR